MIYNSQVEPGCNSWLCLKMDEPSVTTPVVIVVALAIAIAILAVLTTSQSKNKQRSEAWAEVGHENISGTWTEMCNS